MSTRVSALVIIILIHSTIEYQQWRPWRTDRRPTISGDTIPLRAISPFRRQIQRKIVFFHNLLRTKVVPKAANMLRMTWNKVCARSAQKWSDKCLVLQHDNVTGRYVDKYGACGQNIFVTTQKVPWLFAIKTWWLEKDNFTYGSAKNDLSVIGHYTQMVWASTHQVGCGLSKCFLKDKNGRNKTYYSYICNYCPIGNRPGQLGRPYKKGRPCGMCKKHCNTNKLCTNPCYAADLWSNCKELHQRWPKWLCQSPTAKGRDRFNQCLATCNCRKKFIHD